MQVIAQRPGFYGADFKPAGAIFTVRAGEVASWFRPVPASDAPGETAQQTDTTEAQQPGKPEAASETITETANEAAKPRRGRPPSAGLRKQNSPPVPEHEAAAPDLP